MKIRLVEIEHEFNGRSCWVHARAGYVRDNEYVMTAQRLDIEGSDAFGNLHTCTSLDQGETWSEFKPDSGFEEELLKDGVERVVANFTPALHERSGKLLGTGSLVPYDLSVKPKRVYRREERFGLAYAVYDSDEGSFCQWRELVADIDGVRCAVNAGCTQRYDLPDGNILLPVSLRGISTSAGHHPITMLLCTFDGDTLQAIGHGDLIDDPDEPRGMGEQSIAFCTKTGEYVLSIRADTHGYFAISSDGLHYETHRIWRWDDGSNLENYNTQQHLIAQGEDVYLVYTRRGAGNDHVFRHRAPLFMAMFDCERRVLVRDSEVELIPERGARLGNFGVTRVSDSESWVVAAEWMQPKGCERHGSKNSIFISKISW
jgi:hypothetical protein